MCICTHIYIYTCMYTFIYIPIRTSINMYICVHTCTCIGHVHAYYIHTDWYFTQAYKQGMTGKGYVWILMGWYSHKFWEEGDDSIDCTVEEMRHAVHGFIGTETIILNDDPDIATIGNIVSPTSNIKLPA